MAEKEPLSNLQIKAFYAVLQAFVLETSSMSSFSEKRAEIIQNMVDELEITEEIYTSVTNKIQKNLEILQQKEDSFELPRWSFNVPKAGKDWVKPESFIKKWVIIKQSQTEFDEYKITAYNPKTEMHCLEKSISNDGDRYFWLDLRRIDPKNLVLEGGATTDLDFPNKSASIIRRSRHVQ